MEAFRYQALDAAGRAVSGRGAGRHAAPGARAAARAGPAAFASIRNAHASARAPGRAASLGIRAEPADAADGDAARLRPDARAGAERADRGSRGAPGRARCWPACKAEVMAGASLAGARWAATSAASPSSTARWCTAARSRARCPACSQHLADYLDARQALRQKTSLALLYPVLVTVVAVAIVAGLLVYVVPQVVQVFQQSRQALPLLTRALIALVGLPARRLALPARGFHRHCGTLRVALRRAAVRRRWHAISLAPARGSGRSCAASTPRASPARSPSSSAAACRCSRRSTPARDVMSNLVMRDALAARHRARARRREPVARARRRRASSRR